MAVPSPCLNCSRLLLQFPDSTEFAFKVVLPVAAEPKTAYISWLCWSETEIPFFSFCHDLYLFLYLFSSCFAFNTLSLPVTLEKVNMMKFTLVGHISCISA